MQIAKTNISSHNRRFSTILYPKNPIFATLNIALQAGNCQLHRYDFISVCSIRRFRTPVWSINVPTACKVLSDGKGGTAIFKNSTPNLNEYHGQGYKIHGR